MPPPTGQAINSPPRGLLSLYPFLPRVLLPGGPAVSMERTAALCAAAAAVVVLLTACGGAQCASLARAPPAPDPLDDPCFLIVAGNFTDCLDYVNPANNTTPAPNSPCCKGVGDFIKLSPQCLCYILKIKNATDIFGFDVDRGKALNLPNVCKKKLPLDQISKCSGNSSSAAAAANSKCFPPVAEKLISCIDYVDPGINSTKKPSARGQCCTGVKSFLAAYSSCLCSLVNVKPGDYPLPIDRSKVLQLPGTCKATIPSFRCSGNTTIMVEENSCIEPVVNKLAPCVDYVDPAGNKTNPPVNGACCKGLKGFLEEDFGCICSLINVKPGDYPIAIERPKALSLVGACNATIPSLTCSGNVTSRAPANACLMPVVDNLASCVDYVDPNVTDDAQPLPDGACCKGLRNFLQNETVCACSLVLNNSKIYPIAINTQKAYTLSQTCNAELNITFTRKCYPGGSPESPSTPQENAAAPSFTASATTFLSCVSLAIAAAFF